DVCSSDLENTPGFHGRHVAVHEVKVRATDSAGSHFDDDVAIILDRRIIDSIAAYVALAVPAECFHRKVLLPLRATPLSEARPISLRCCVGFRDRKSVV